MAKKKANKHRQSQKENGKQSIIYNTPPQQRSGRYSGKKPTKGEQVVPAGICKKTKNVNVSNFQKKNKQAVHTSIAKNKTSRLMHMQTQNAQKQTKKQTNNDAPCIFKTDARCKF